MPRQYGAQTDVRQVDVWAHRYTAIQCTVRQWPPLRCRGEDLGRRPNDDVPLVRTDHRGPPGPQDADPKFNRLVESATALTAKGQKIALRRARALRPQRDNRHWHLDWHLPDAMHAPTKRFCQQLHAVRHDHSFWRTSASFATTRQGCCREGGAGADGEQSLAEEVRRYHGGAHHRVRQVFARRLTVAHHRLKRSGLPKSSCRQFRRLTTKSCPGQSCASHGMLCRRRRWIARRPNANATRGPVHCLHNPDPEL